MYSLLSYELTNRHYSWKPALSLQSNKADTKSLKLRKPVEISQTPKACRFFDTHSETMVFRILTPL